MASLRESIFDHKCPSQYTDTKAWLLADIKTLKTMIEKEPNNTDLENMLDQAQRELWLIEAEHDVYTTKTTSMEN